MRISLPVFFIFIAVASATVFAAGYSFGTKQGVSSVTVEPGQDAYADIFFFVDSEYGDRITHIILQTTELPEGWSLEYDPPLHEQEYDISGILTNISENLYVEPRPVLPEPPVLAEPGYQYLLSPSGKGYLQARKAGIKIKVPEDAQLGQSYKISVMAEAFWLGNIGQVALKQTRSFYIVVTVARSEYTERVIIAPIIGEEPEQPTQEVPDNTLLMAVAAIAIIAIALVIYLYTKKNKSAPQFVEQTKGVRQPKVKATKTPAKKRKRKK